MIRPTQAPGAQAQPQFVNSPRYPAAASANTGGAGVPVMHGSIRTASSNVHVSNGQSPPPVYRAPPEASQHPSFSPRQAPSAGPPVAQGRPAGGSFVPAAVGGAPAATPIQSHGSYASPGSFVSPPLPAVNQLLRSPGNSFVAAPPALALLLEDSVDRREALWRRLRPVMRADRLVHRRVLHASGNRRFRTVTLCAWVQCRRWELLVPGASVPINQQQGQVPAMVCKAVS